MYDLLFGKGLEKNAAGKYKDVVNRHRARLNAELVKIKIKRRISKNEDLIPKTIREQVVLPRYARVNLLKSTVDQVIKAFVKEGFRLGEPLTDLSSIPYAQALLFLPTFLCHLY